MLVDYLYCGERLHGLLGLFRSWGGGGGYHLLQNSVAHTPTISIDPGPSGLAVSSDSRLNQSMDGKRSRGDVDTDDDEDDEPAVTHAKKNKTSTAAKKVSLG